jgi:adenylate cyclase class IV
MFHELEYKYKADNVGYLDFKNLMETLDPKKVIEISSPDTYFKSKDDSKFLRFRNGLTPELTFKVKIDEANNWDRIEVDLPLDYARINRETASKFATLLGYIENFTIYKSCFVYIMEEVNYVYYIVFDENMKEKGRFVEVEVNKEKVQDLEQGKALLNDSAEKLKSLGLTPQNRMKKSLFELYRK